MRTKDLRDGMIIRLGMDVVNQGADRRHKYDWTKQPQFDEGLRLTVREHTYQHGDTTSRWFTLQYGNGDHMNDRHVAFDKIVFFSEHVNRSLEEIVNQYGGEWLYKDIIKELLRRGPLTNADVEAIAKELHERED